MHLRLRSCTCTGMRVPVLSQKCGSLCAPTETLADDSLARVDQRDQHIEGTASKTDRPFLQKEFAAMRRANNRPPAKPSSHPRGGAHRGPMR